jgi:hypothetical protein
MIYIIIEFLKILFGRFRIDYILNAGENETSERRRSKKEYITRYFIS